MPRARKEQGKNNKGTKKPAVKTTSAQVGRVSAKKAQPSKEESSAGLKITPPKVSRKNLMWLSTIAGVLVLLFLLGRFLVVAWVDNKPVTLFEYFNTLDKRYGKEVKDELIVEKLIMNEAQKKGVNVSLSEVDAEIKKLEDQQKGAENLDQLLSINNLTREDLKKLIRRQLITERLFSEGVNIDDQEVNKYIDDNKEIYSTPSAQISEEIKKGVKEQLKQQKINENYNKWIGESLNGSRVVRL